ncbi:MULTISPECIES: MATE family efflux transporter [Ramlibacter]|uniref:MATE family efflux transporter n=1 Tax=Ramlibacter TaxID=174951 RepID=UPI00257BF2F6|nr:MULTISPECIES: MATE family efflux transporter [Ramlibacter]
MSEFRTILRHALTVLVGQLALMGFGMTDTIVAGRYSEGALAALSVGTAVYITVFVALNGVLQALLPIWAELHGEGRPQAVGRSVRQGLYLAGLLLLAGGTALLFPAPLLHWTQVPAALEGDVRHYLAALVFALPAALLFRMYASFSQAVGHPREVTAIQAAALVLKVPLTLWFVNGGLGLASMGAAGCAWATVAVTWLMLASAAWRVRTPASFRPYEVLHAVEAPDWRQIAGFARLGVPAGLSVMVEVTSFTLMALFIARLGTAAAAAHQIAGNLAAVMYMVPFSLAIATSARVSYWLGAGHAARARHAAATGLRMAAVMAVVLAATMALGRAHFAAVYSASPEVVAIATVLLAWVVPYHLGDATQVMCVFILRCFRVTVAPLVAYCLLLWGVGLTGGYLLAYRGLAGLPAQESPAAFWAAGAVALLLLALILPPILWRAVRRATMPPGDAAARPGT